MLNSLSDKIGLNLKFEQAFVLVLGNISGPSAVCIIIETVPHTIIVTHNGDRMVDIVTHNGDRMVDIVTHNGDRMVEWSQAHRFACLVFVVVRGSSLAMTV